MLDFFFKKKTITLDCFTYDDHAYNFAKIDKATNYFPDWWENIPTSSQIGDKYLPSIKSCLGFTEYYKRGIVIPCWSEFTIKLSEKDKSEINAESSKKIIFSSHHRNQFEHFHGDDGVSVKINSVWRFKTNKKVSFTWTQPSWNMRKNLFNMSMLPAVVDFYDQSVTNINIFLRYTEFPQIINVLPLTPLVILHPLTDSKIKIKNHLVSENEFKMSDVENMLIQKFNSPQDLIDFRKKRKELLKKINSKNN